MTEPIEIVRLREQIARLIQETVKWHSPALFSSPVYEHAPKHWRDMWEKQANIILTLTKPDGTKAIGVIADEQKLPDKFCATYDNAGTDSERELYYKSGQEDMINSGRWVKVIGVK